jgi:ketosteroid isomerase-like protein
MIMSTKMQTARLGGTLLLMILVIAATALSSADLQKESTAASEQRLDILHSVEAPVAVLDAFGKALVRNDMNTVQTLLDPAVIILESGRAEHSRREYLSHHAHADAKFLANADIRLIRRIARGDQRAAWVASETELHTTEDGKPLKLLSTETAILRNTDEGWRIVHVHWSSSTK